MTTNAQSNSETFWKWFGRVTQAIATIGTILNATKTAEDMAGSKPIEVNVIFLWIFIFIVWLCAIYISFSKIEEKRAIITVGARVPRVKTFKFTLLERVVSNCCWSFILLYTFFAFAWKLHSFKQLQFSKDEFGVLILSIAGDTNSIISQKYYHTLEEEIVSLDQKGPISIHLVPDMIGTTEEFREAHQHAKQIGKKYKAEIVLWGYATADDKDFFPSITIVNHSAPELGVIADEVDLKQEDTSEIELSPTLVAEADTFTYFLIGFVKRQQGDLYSALNYFNKGIEKKGTSTGINGDCLYYAGLCHYSLGENGIDSSNQLLYTIYSASASADAFRRIGGSEQFVGRAENLLGTVTGPQKVDWYDS